MASRRLAGGRLGLGAALRWLRRLGVGAADVNEARRGWIQEGGSLCVDRDVVVVGRSHGEVVASPWPVGLIRSWSRRPCWAIVVATAGYSKVLLRLLAAAARNSAGASMELVGVEVKVHRVPLARPSSRAW